MVSDGLRPDDSDRPTCRSRKHDPATAPPLARGLHICASCLEVLEDTLIELPALFELCADLLDLGPGDLRDRVGDTRPHGINLCESAVSVRAEILGTLTAWSWFVTSERGVPGPNEPAIRDLVRFLSIQLQWLCGHPGAPALVDELTELTASVSTALRHNTFVRAAVGTCLLPGCTATVYAEAQHEGGEVYEVACEAGHVWAPHRWLALREEQNENRHGNGNKRPPSGTDRSPIPEKTE